MEDDNEIDESAGQLRGALPPVVSPAALNERVRHTLLARQLIVEGGISVQSRFRRMLTYGVVAATFLVAGMFIGRGSGSRDSASPDQRYALLLYGMNASESSDSHSSEYGAWMRQVAAGRSSFIGEELAAEVATLGAPMVPGEDAGPLLGFFIIAAESDSAAVSIANTSPHIKYGGTIVLQKVLR